jgi:RimJ/RimL family protein N-acetyltransferase
VSQLELRGERAVLVPVAVEHVAELRRIRLTPEVRAWWGRDDTAPPWPFNEPGATVFTVLVDSAVRGMIQYGEENEPDYRYASIDVFLDPEIHSQGVGRDAVRTLARYLVDEHGHHRLTIDPAAANLAAIRCYTSVGFRPVGIMRNYERDPDGPGWHDSLLMDLLAGDL